MSVIQIGRTGINPDAFVGMTKAEFRKKYEGVLPVDLDAAWEKISKANKGKKKAKSSE